MTTEERFKAAVDVIRNLPKEGSYVPSHELQLRFYAFFKQSNYGANNEPKPAFWDVIGRAKWNAWKTLGDMSKEVAMESYIEQLMSIVETMSYNQTVDAFLESVGSFYQSVDADHVDLVLGPVIAKIKSQKQGKTEVEINGVADQVPTHQMGNGFSHYNNPISGSAEELSIKTQENLEINSGLDDSLVSDDEEFCDTIAMPVSSRTKESMYELDKIDCKQHNELSSIASISNAGNSEMLKTQLAYIEDKIGAISEQNKMIHLILSSISKELEKKREHKPWWKIFDNITKYQLAFFILWPFAAHWLVTSMRRKR